VTNDDKNERASEAKKGRSKHFFKPKKCKKQNHLYALHIDDKGKPSVGFPKTTQLKLIL